MSKESGGAPGGGGNHNGGVNGGGANSGSSSNGSGSNSGKGGGKNDSSSKGSSQSSSSGSSKGSSSSSTSSSKSSSSTSSKSSSASKAGTTQAGNQQSGSLTGGKGGLAGGDGSLASSDTTAGKKESSKPGVASRVSSVNQALSSYGAAPSTPNHNISSIGGPSMYGMNDGSFTSKVKGAFGLGPSTNFNETIKTDNVNGVIGNLQRKAQEGTLTARDKANIADASGAYNKQAGANVVGGTLLGGAGKAIAGLAGDVGNTDSYFSGIGRDAANGDLDSSRLVGQRDSQLGSEGGLDSTLKAGVNLLSGLVPGAGLVMTGAVNGLTQPASGFGAVLNQLNEQAGNTVNKGSGQIGNGSGKDYLAPPRQSLTGAQQGEGTLAFDSSYYDPSRFNVTAGKRGY
ncbi:hypothetical protein EHZ47_01770 [Aeromonas jandaei]|uniref:hypothetical protein n=1 Tax=Aeromonas jandaei TaxID=650 RepID=UPI000F523BE2|nr:hypothetical protein [Aeromonas jandaei]RQM78845.1 hypothetical protein EHZ47_01770 [Aeromonas jandaei]